MFCSRCGSEVAGKSRFCPSCGLDLMAGTPVETGLGSAHGKAILLGEHSVVYGAPAIVIDFGTATNFDVVDIGGRYVGGALAPGLIVALEAMASRAARLFFF